MSVTLEQIQILSREYDLAEHEYQKALDAMRRYSPRMQILHRGCVISVMKYRHNMQNLHPRAVHR